MSRAILSAAVSARGASAGALFTVYNFDSDVLLMIFLFVAVLWLASATFSHAALTMLPSFGWQVLATSGKMGGRAGVTHNPLVRCSSSFAVHNFVRYHAGR